MSLPIASAAVEGGTTITGREDHVSTERASRAPAPRIAKPAFSSAPITSSHSEGRPQSHQRDSGEGRGEVTTFTKTTRHSSDRRPLSDIAHT